MPSHGHFSAGHGVAPQKCIYLIFSPEKKRLQDNVGVPQLGFGMAENPKSCPHPTHTRCSLLRLRPPTPGPPSSAPRPPAAPASATGLCAHKTRPGSVFSSETSLGSSSSFILNKRLECGVWQLPPVTATETAPGAAAPPNPGRAPPGTQKSPPSAVLLESSEQSLALQLEIQAAT